MQTLIFYDVVSVEKTHESALLFIVHSL